jgi:drug/metabolite transporter (DMT)-like permease
LGLALLSLQVVGGRPTVNAGDLLVLACAVAYAGQIVALGRYAAESDPRALTIQQLALTAVAFAIVTPLDEVRAPTTAAVWIALIATAIGSSVYGITVQTWAQQRISPTRAAVIFSSEAPFAALSAHILADERLPPRAWVGAALILAGMLVAELRPAGPRQEA